MQNKKFYYIGVKQSDIAADFNGGSDKFFTGSITIFGNNEDGNIAFNVLNNKQLNIADPDLVTRNEELYSAFIAEQCRRIAVEDKNAVFMPYSTQFAVMIPPEFKNRAVCTNDPKILSFLNSKFNFKNLLMKSNIRQAPFNFFKGSEILTLLNDKTFPQQKEVVIQTEYGAGGKGTFVVTKKSFENKQYEDMVYARINPAQTYIISDYIENICSASFRVQVSDNETAMYPPSVQIMHDTTFIGADPFEFSKFDKKIKNEVECMAQDFGYMLRNIENYVNMRGVENKKLRGCFGMDIIIGTDNHIYAIETNPRFTGCTGLDNILSHLSGTGSVFEHAYRACSGKTDFSDKFKKILSRGRSIYATDQENYTGNKEGSDKVSNKEPGSYTYRIFTQVQGYNVFDDRVAYKKFMSKFADKLLKNLVKPKSGNLKAMR